MGFWEIIYFSYSYQPIFATHGEMTDSNKVRNPQHFASGLGHIWIPARSNPEIQIWILDHFWLVLMPWQRFALFEHSVVGFVFELKLAKLKFAH